MKEMTFEERKISIGKELLKIVEKTGTFAELSNIAIATVASYIAEFEMAEKNGKKEASDFYKQNGIHGVIRWVESTSFEELDKKCSLLIEEEEKEEGYEMIDKSSLS